MPEEPEGQLIFAAQVGRPIDSAEELRDGETQKVCAYCRHMIAVGPEDPEVGKVPAVCQSCTGDVMERISGQVQEYHRKVEEAERKIRRLKFSARAVYWLLAVIVGLLLALNIREESWGWAAFNGCLLAYYLWLFSRTWWWD